MSFPSIEKNNEYFLFWMIALLPVFGSGITVIVAGILIWALISLCFKRFPLKYEAKDIPLLLACGIYFAVQFFLTLYHAKKISDFEVFLPSLVALMPFLLLPRFRATPNLDYLKVLFRGAYYGCLFAVVIGLTQSVLFSSRAEGGDGNPLIFASVCALLGIVSLVGIKRNDLFRWPLLPALGYFMALLAIMAAESRGPLLALIISGAVFTLFNLGDIFKFARLKKSHSILFGAIALALSVSAIGFIGKKSYTELTSRQEQTNKLNSSQIRLAYLDQGIRLFEEKPIFGYGAANRSMIMNIYSEKLSFKTGPIEQKVIVSWHRHIPIPLRKYYTYYAREHWRSNRRKEIQAAKAAGSPIPPEKKKTFKPTYEKIIVNKKNHGHLHNEYLMHVVDGGLVGLISYIVLIFGTTAFSYMRPKWKMKQIQEHGTKVVIISMAVLGVFNVAFENDIIAVTFILLLIGLRLAKKNVTQSSKLI